MSAFSQLDSQDRRPSAFHYAIIVFFLLVFLIARDLSLTWLVLIVAASFVLTIIMLARNIEQSLLLAFIFTAPIDISKALIVEGGIYSPGLSISVPDLFALPLIVFWYARLKLVDKSKIHWDPLRRAALILLAWLWVTAFVSDDRMAGILAAVTYTKFFLVYLVLSDCIRTNDLLKKVLGAFAVGLLMQLLMISAQIITNSPLEIQGAKVAEVGTRLVFEYADGLHAFRPSGFLHHPNVMADYMVFLIPTLFILFLLGKKQIGSKAWMFSGVLLIGAGLALLVSLSRGGWIACVVSLMFVILCLAKYRLVDTAKIKSMIALASVALLVVVIVYPAILLRITQTDHRSSESRLVMMDQALLIISKQPIMGVGFGGYNRAAQTHIPHSYAGVSEAFQKKLLEGIVHNKYLLVTAEHGVVGLALFLYLLWTFSRTVLNRRFWQNRQYAALNIGLVGAILGQAVFYFFDHFYADVRPGLLWVFLGLVHALYLMQARQNLKIS